MATTDRSLLDLGIKTSADNEDTLVSVVSGQASRVKIGLLLNLISQWSNLKNKPFDNISPDDFTIDTDSLSGNTTLKLSPSISDNAHRHDNKRYLDKISESNDGTILYDNSPISDWNTLTNKPFESFSEEDFIVDESNVVSVGTSIKSQLHIHDNKEIIDKFSVDTDGNLLFNGQDIKADGIDFTALSEMLVQGENIIISTDEVAQTITVNASGIDFTALSNALTLGTQSGISITTDTENNVFNFEVTGIPTLDIDSEGYWTIDGERGSNPTKAQGNDGFSPVASVAQTDTGATITITDSSGTTTTDIINGVNGTTPHIDDTSKHWYVGEIDTGVVAEGTTTIQTTSVNYTGTLTVDDWVGDSVPFTQSVNISGVTSDLSPIIDLVVSNDTATGIEEMSQWSYITKATTDIGIITFSCYEKKPSIALNFKVKVV